MRNARRDEPETRPFSVAPALQSPESDMTKPTAKKPRPSRTRRRGAVLTEYLISVAILGLGLTWTFLGRGEQLLFDYVNARDLVLVPGM